ncbi:uncharacterized protein TNCV_4408281 [Trichonephila clavipes]|nr:uncharacterized protein TNCV_4408281 [Trichonephila clavipes]
MKELIDIKSVEALCPHVGLVWEFTGGRVSLEIMVTDSLLECHDFELNTTEVPSCRGVGIDSRLNKAFKLCNFISKIMVDFHERILFSDEAHFWLNGYINKQNFRIWSEANPQVNVETPLHPEKLTVWCALWAGGILLQKR